MSYNRVRNRHYHEFAKGFGKVKPEVWYLGDTYQTSSSCTQEECYDVVGNPSSPNPLLIRRWSDRAFMYSGDSQYWRISNWNISLNPYGFPPESISGQLSDEAIVTQGLARTNPSRPYVDPGLLLQDLKDIPGMIRDLGRFITSGYKIVSPLMLSHGFISWEFGWAPLIDDIKKLLDFHSAVEKRKKELQKLRNGGLRRRYSARAVTQQFQFLGMYTPALYGGSPQANVYAEATSNKWVTVRYVPTADTPPLDANDQEALARSLVFGLNLSVSSIWELLPWSWLVDWCSSVGDVLATTRNVLHTETKDVCLMEHISGHVTHIDKISSYVGTYTINKNGIYESKRRRVDITGPTLTAYIPFLDGMQTSILSALAIMKYGSWHH